MTRQEAVDEGDMAVSLSAKGVKNVFHCCHILVPRGGCLHIGEYNHAPQQNSVHDATGRGQVENVAKKREGRGRDHLKGRVGTLVLRRNV